MGDVHEVIDVTPHQTLMPKLGKTGYSVPQAIAELVDNSIDARIEGETLHVTVQIGKNGISVADDGIGMSRSDIKDAMVLGKSSKKRKLGEFGLGLKTSCTNLGRYFRVVTSRQGDGHEYSVDYDEDQWLTAADAWTMPLRTSDCAPESHFTVIEIKRLNTYYAGMPDIVLRDLQQRFAPLIGDGSVVLKVNKKTCKPDAFELLEGSRRDFLITDGHGNVIYGWHGLLKQGANKGLYGFHTYRLGRMITAYDKIAIGEHPTISRIIGEIHLDHVPVTHNKREFDRESELFRTAEAALTREFQGLLQQARHQASVDTLSKAVRSQMARWVDCVARGLTASELKAFTAAAASLNRPVRDDAGTEIADVDVEERESGGEPEEREDRTPRVASEEAVRERVPHDTHKKPRHVIKVKGKTVDFRHEFRGLGERGPWYTSAVNADSSLDIYTNTDFPAYFATGDKAFYATLHVVESIAELLVRETGASQEEYDDIRQVLLRKASAVKDQWTEDEAR